MSLVVGENMGLGEGENTYRQVTEYKTGDENSSVDDRNWGLGRGNSAQRVVSDMLNLKCWQNLKVQKVSIP